MDLMRGTILVESHSAFGSSDRSSSSSHFSPLLAKREESPFLRANGLSSPRRASLRTLLECCGRKRDSRGERWHGKVCLLGLDCGGGEGWTEAVIGVGAMCFWEGSPLPSSHPTSDGANIT